MDSFDREQYLQQLREYYSGDRDRIDQFLEDMSDSLDCYLKEHPAADASEIYARFGDPEELKKQQELVRSESHTQTEKKCNTNSGSCHLCSEYSGTWNLCPPGVGTDY